MQIYGFFVISLIYSIKILFINMMFWRKLRMEWGNKKAL